MQKFKKYLKSSFLLLQPLNTLLKKKDRIVLYSNIGFRDNVKAIYEYAIEHNLNKKYTIICVSNDYLKFKKNKDENIRFVSNKIGLYYFLTSKYFFYSFGKFPIAPSSKQIVINLWHGTPLKTIGTFNKNEEHSKQDYFSFVIASSKHFVPIMAKSFGTNPDKVIICGQPRNDNLFKSTEYMNIYFEKNRYEKIFLWLPTYRKANGFQADSSGAASETRLSIFTTWGDLIELDKYLKQKKSLCIIKLHPLQEWKNTQKYSFENIRFYTQQLFEKENLDLYRILPISDALITDYSSVFYDYLLLDRPIAFTINDLNEYADTRGFVFENPLQFMPGEKISTKHEFIRFLENVYQGDDRYQSKRKEINDFCNYYTDGNNCERILKMVGVI